jgi:hypothetical protein
VWNYFQARGGRSSKSMKSKTCHFVLKCLDSGIVGKPKALISTNVPCLTTDYPNGAKTQSLIHTNTNYLLDLCILLGLFNRGYQLIA